MEQPKFTVKEHIELSEKEKIVPLDKEQTVLSDREEQTDQQALSLDNETNSTTNDRIAPAKRKKEEVVLSTSKEDSLLEANNSPSHPVEIITCSPVLKPQSGPNLKINTQKHQKRRNNSISTFDFYSSPFSASPMLSSGTSTSSRYSALSFSSTDSTQSKVDDMIYQFETGIHHVPHRRYSVDSFYLNNNSKPLIPFRKFEFEPIKDEWRRRDTANSPILLRPSQSTPTYSITQKYPQKRTMPPIPEKTKSMWA
ncbi:hypothetical protein A0J61_07195 [Choanephora cucurbitarum]|uniref:Uncharacterized protein n=1 Tax=Choanephora cucurbitarum TaxID=101091 RepID=A0A1C7NBN5_9FUNG|nr:hypothetical protein A0J61_07195 [Choanephora cucurbitarum]